MPSAPRVAVRPGTFRSFLTRAVEAGGGVVVEPERAEALVWADPGDAEGLRALLEAHPDLRWVQVPFAGVEPLIEVMDRGRIWTCGKGVYAEEVAEHALALALAGLRHLVPYARAASWSGHAGRNLLGARVTVLGAGGIAGSFLRMLAPFGCEVRVVRRRADAMPGADATVTLDELDSLLPSTDVLVLALALTDETAGLVDARVLSELPDHAWLVNVARGAHVVTDDLVDALRRGVIGGAALDVTDPEPLPDGHPLWDLDTCLITPHTANTPEMAVPVLSRRVTENVRRYAAGADLLGPVDLDAGY